MADPSPMSRRRFLKGVLAGGAASAAALTFGNVAPANTGTTMAAATVHPACDAAYDACIAYCRTLRFKAARAICYAGCMDAWVKCEAARAVLGVAEVVLDAGADAAQWLRDHPEVVIGTIIVVGAVTLVVVAGPAGGLALVAI